jgi:hypothetical protein
MSSRRAAPEGTPMDCLADDPAQVIELIVHRRRTGEPASSGESLGKLTIPEEALKSRHTGQRLVDELTKLARDGGRG